MHEQHAWIRTQVSTCGKASLHSLLTIFDVKLRILLIAFDHVLECGCKPCWPCFWQALQQIVILSLRGRYEQVW